MAAHKALLKSLSAIGIGHPKSVHYNLLPEELVEATLNKKQGMLADTGALCVETGKFTGRSPKDRFIVEDEVTRERVDWNNINKPFSRTAYDSLREKVAAYLNEREIYVRDVEACADPEYRTPLRVITEYPWSNLFVHNMFLKLKPEALHEFTPEWTVLNAPGFEADPAIDGTRQPNFSIINFGRKEILVGGSGYTGEIKKGVFSVLNFELPAFRDLLTMHCSANIGQDEDVAVFFGLSGTGKTTLSADPERLLIGDDEHGWGDNGVFNFEGGCYAKTIDLTREKEPEIYDAIRHGAILENIGFFPNTRTVDYTDSSITLNTRVSYPIEHILHIAQPSMGGHPQNIFFLTADAFGVLPPVSRLTPGQAMYHFISGYTAKVAGTEEGVNEPEATFSACFGAPFMPLPPTTYAAMLGERMEKYGVNVWLINTGWSGGAYGTGSRIKLKYTRAMIKAALNGSLEGVRYEQEPVFGLNVPTACPGVPEQLLHPRETWADAAAYDKKAHQLAEAFVKNFVKFEAQASEEMLAASPKAGSFS
ncbi:phosphoenolpyruvate carboxykinase (ATP) [Phaeodactylibacter luteus]|uniref:Phosphoenolpyruvate carboxykinase (ATP) n=1 Tax=Phaeodactylibacter luteus TaxID=1564516 RepID=A0A5C6RWP1_9BACT|nr:phosphoenolpyruvate carboxykinase (ATP) [Phaeodactylibacter luteus]TXB66593.1 phosphoenolpyruvate carboxykinase (ATP) [Phaeodactylibacter luteus]